MGGIARRASEIKNVRSRGLPLVVVDGGEFAPEYNGLGEIKFETLVESFGHMKYDALSLGEREIRMHNDKYDAWNVLSSSKVPVATLNVTYKGKRLRERPTIIERGGLRIGLFGLFTGNVLHSGAGKEWVIEDAAMAAEEALAYTKENADVTVVMLSGKTAQAHRLVRSYRGIDVVIVTHSSIPSPQILRYNDSLLISAGTRGKYLGRVDACRKDGKWNFSGRFVVLDDKIPKDPVLQATYSKYQARVEQFVKKEAVQGKRNPAKDFSPVHAATECRTCHGNVYRGWLATPHAHALETLVGRNEQYNPECVGCHTTGYRKGGFVSFETTPQYKGVQCVSCHGPMKGHIELHSGRQETSEVEAMKGAEVTKYTCMGCHTPERDDDFDFERDKKEVH